MKLFRKLAVLCMALTLCCGVGAAMAACGEKDPAPSSTEAPASDVKPIENGYTFKLLKADGSPAAGYQIQICKEDNSICLAPVVVAANGVANVVVENKTIPYAIHILDESYAPVEDFDGMSVIPANYDGGVIELKLK